MITKDKFILIENLVSTNFLVRVARACPFYLRLATGLLELETDQFNLDLEQSN